MSHGTRAGFHCAVHVTPLAVIASDGGPLYGLDMEGNPLDLAARRERLPGMEAEGTLDAALLP